MRLDLPYPHKVLWPNGRTRNHKYRASLVAKARTHAHWAAKAAGAKAGDPVGRIVATYHPKAYGPLPDLDNCIASFKSYRDGIADAFGTDDRNFDVTVLIGARKPGGGVTVEIW